MSSAGAASAKGDGYVIEANKTLSKTSILSVFGMGKSQKYEDAADLFTKAGNAYKLANQWQSAGNAFLKASECLRNSDSANDALNSLVEAGNCFKKVSPEDAVRTFLDVIALYNDNGRFGMSAKYYKEIAEMCETDNNPNGAMENFQLAADMFMNDNKKQNANQCLLKVATLASNDKQLGRAADIFENIGREAMESKLGQYSAKGYFFQSLLCHLASGDTVSVRNKLDAYKSVDYSFQSSRECGFIEKLLEVGYYIMSLINRSLILI